MLTKKEKKARLKAEFKEKTALLEQEYRQKLVETEVTPKGVSFSAEGKPLFTIGALAVRCARCVEYIRNLHKKGLLPPPFKSEGWSLYTENQLRLLELYLKPIGGKPRLPQLKLILQEVVEHWEDDYGEYKDQESRITRGNNSSQVNKTIRRKTGRGDSN